MSVDPIGELIALSKFVGARVPAWVQGYGGNLSVKSGPWLSVKASGFRLDEVGTPGSIARVSRDDFRNSLTGILERRDEDAYATLLKASAVPAEGFGRPSMETALHAAFPAKYVFHFHSLVAMMAAEPGHEALQLRLRRHLEHLGLEVRVLGYGTPGLDLANLLREGRGADVYLLAKHGVLLAAESPRLMEVWARAESACLEVEECGLLSVIDESLSPREQYGAWPWAGRIPVYFPDSALFLAGMQEHGFSLWSRRPAELNRAERNLQEMCAATFLLGQVDPGFKELDAPEIARLSGLPVERLRKSEGEIGVS